ncbi:MAG: branched-chain amino acid ABC transporter permease [Deltaproteobacteria bacterium]|nr:branched-chain amino acid ABC transporter permease [Deltaproteobacteria bacterium]MBW2015805.1 branched-chain amino acid ABC transporter permease [Deltaproteobacteria bacterium]MBW2129211.1 branched-chain amino acid ABC transporter permease [Deltaproteobacteria bacterium]MBW2303368.1 branched-chain amino acid ABC transporter permease [Deltaproteobacteria bacterium]
MDATLFFQLLIAGILLGGIYALASIGLTLIFGVMKIVNFAHGEFLMLAMYFSYWLFHSLHLDPYISIIVVAPGLFLLGLIVYRIIIKPTIGAPVLAQIFVTVGLSMVIENLALLIWSADFRTVSLDYLQHSILIGPFPSLGLEEMIINPARLIAFIIGTSLAVAFYLFLKFSYTGKVIRATSQDRSTAQLMGINIDKIYRVTFAIGIFLVGVAGALMIPIYTVHPFVGFEFVLVMFVVVVLGGMGSIVGAMIAGIFIGIIEVFSGYILGPDSKEAIYFLVFIAVLVIKPSGLFGLEGEEELERIEAIDA